MKKSLQEIIKDSQDKELTDLIKKIEDSYILKGLDWFDKKLMLKKYFPESKVAKGFDSLRDLIFYGNLGIIPGDKQEKYTKHLGYDKLKITRNAIVYGYLLGGFQLGLAILSSTCAPVSIGFWALSLFTLANSSAILTYSSITKKPFGAPYVEIPYRIGKCLLKKKEKAKSTYETKNLNNNTTLDLS